MKKTLIFIIALVVMAIAAPQASAQASWGIVAGMDVSTLKFKQPLIPVKKGVGEIIGVKSELNIPGIGFGVGVSLQYTQRGAVLGLGTKEIWASQGYGNDRCYLHYLEMPFYLRWMFQRIHGVENVVAPFVFAGPSFSFLMGHSNIDALKYAGMAVSIDMGVGARIFYRWHVTLSYDLGATYAVKTKLLDDFSARNNTWKLTATYFF